AGGRGIASMIKEYAARRKGVYAAISLGQRLYLSALKNADVVIGNSSSALTEAPSFKKPAVNIGGRQKGRLRAASVIDSAGDAASIEKAVRKALSPEFRGTLKGMESPYGKPGASIRIKEHLKTVDLKFLTKKKFYDIGI
ncbi:MAG: UDP-N-acetylglucosamine 2-epimerase, partial [Deltaproteobacteria bacterium]